MSSIIIIKRRLVKDSSQLKDKQNLMVTSTPIKSKTSEHLEMIWPSPVEKSSNEIPNPHVLPIKTTGQKLPTEETENLEKTDAGTESIDKICLVNRFSGPSNVPEDPPSKHVESKSERQEVKQLKIMDSDEEEEFWENRNWPIKKRKNKITKSNKSLIDSQQFSKKMKTQEQTESLNTLYSMEKSERIETQDRRITLSNDIVDSHEDILVIGQTEREETPPAPLPSRRKRKNDKRQKRVLEGGNNLKQDQPSKKSSQGEIFESMEQRVEETDRENENAVRRSKRERSKPLEFWNGERMKIDRDFNFGIVTAGKKKKNLAKSEAEMESEEKEIEKVNYVSENIRNSENTDKPERNLTQRSGTKRRGKSILKSVVNTKSKANVRFSAIGTGTTIDGPTSKKRLKPDWVINFPGLDLGAKQRPISENCVLLPGLNTAMGIITSAVIQMRRKAINHSQASDQHHLIFCVMVGTVTVTIEETSVRMNTYGHFTVPCGVSYSIENTGMRRAILSFFKIACTCISK